MGGNTSCVEIRSPGGILIIDGGSGARELGRALQDEFQNACLKLNLLLTHFHWDHIQGLPFFAPLFAPGNDISICSARPEEETRNILKGQMSGPYCPVSFELQTGLRSFTELAAGGQTVSGALVHPFPLHHPQGATGFRIECEGIVIVHASDFEHGDPKLDGVLREYSQNADVLIYDAQYTPQEYDGRKGWGHSTWLEATQLARECKVKRLFLFHHDPGHDDECMLNILREARTQFQDTDLATEGLEVRL